MKDTIKSYLRGNEFAAAMTLSISVALGLMIWLSQQTPETQTPNTALVLRCQCEPE